LFRLGAPVLIVDKLRLACEEAALGHGLNVPMIRIIDRQDIQISSDGHILYLASELAEMPGVPLQALISFALYFHTHMAAGQRLRQQAPRSFGQRLAALLVGLRSAPRKLERIPGPAAREEAKASYRGSHVALLQALLMSRTGLQTCDESFAGESLFEDTEQISEFAQHLESLIESDYSDSHNDQLKPSNKLLTLAHKTSKLLDTGDRNANKQVANLNRLYQSIGPVGSVAHVISRVSSRTLSDAERNQVLVELLADVQPVQARLQLVDFAASQLMPLSDTQKLSVMTQLRETLSSLTTPEGSSIAAAPLQSQEETRIDQALGVSPILTWTLLSVLRSKLNLNEAETTKPKPLSDKEKRRCIGELFFIAAELGGEESSISARALRNQVDAVCESLDIDRPVSSPDEFQAAAWLEAMDDLSRFSLHETLSILDVLSLWGQENIIYQAWLDAICQRLKVQRHLASSIKPKSSHTDQATIPQVIGHHELGQ
jgi:hypothetical protein